MCGIAGMYGYRDPRPASEETLRAMADAMLHRGPDADGYLVGSAVGLAMRRLSVIDVEGGAQPVRGARGDAVLVFNGEIYNFRELRSELERLGCRFRTASDTEVIVQAYEQWGRDAFARLNGMFAIALWDRARSTLLLARDPLGIKPLYVHDDGRRLAFASEVRALVAGGVLTPRLDADYLADYLAFGFVPAPATLFAGVHKLLPGHLLECSPDSVTVRRFAPRPEAMFERMNDDEAVEELRRLLRSAVKRQMVADVPVGVLLSGGVDSSAIAALMTETATGAVRSFTVGFAEDFAENELAEARQVARRLGAEHTELRLSMAEFGGTLADAVGHLEEPVATTSTAPFLALSRLARTRVTVALCGQGADEPFGGYPRHAGERLGSVYRALPFPLRRRLVEPLAARLPRARRIKRGVTALSVQDPGQRLEAIFTILDERARRALLREGIPAAVQTNALARLGDDVPGRPAIDRLLYVDTRFGLADNLLLYADKLSMAASLEARVPFLDLDLLAFGERLPGKMRTSPLARKRLLKQAVAPWVPPDVRGRRKVGFATPVGSWLRQEMGTTVRERLLSPGSGCRRYFRMEPLERLLREHASGKHDHQRAIFSLLMFELWHEQFLGRSGADRTKTARAVS